MRAPDQFAIFGHPIELDVTFGGALFTDPDADPLTYEVRLSPEDPALYGVSLEGTRIVGTPRAYCECQVFVNVHDGRGANASQQFVLHLKENERPRIANPNPNILLQSASGVDHDLAQGGQTFVDPEGQALTLRVTIEADPLGFTVQGTRLTGTLHAPGFVRAKIEADDGFGGVSEDLFAVVWASQISDRPVLPAAGLDYAYEDAQLVMPAVLRLERHNDTTPSDNPTTNAGAKLGRVLFYDKRLSITNTHSCGSCHEQSRGFASVERFAAGAVGARTKHSPMHLTNVRFNSRNRYFLDSRAAALEGLALMPIQEKGELGSSLPQLIEELSATDFYPPLFRDAFGSGEITTERTARALSQFLRALISYRSRFDKAYYSLTSPYSHDQPDPALVLTAREIRGRELFIEKQCHHCHISLTFDSPWPDNNGLDLVTNPPDGRFRVGSLRNIAVTGPYMHDGRFATLREVIDHYDSGIKPHPELAGALGGGRSEPSRLNLTEEEKLALEAFFHSLTDDAFLTDPKFSNPFSIARHDDQA